MTTWVKSRRAVNVSRCGCPPHMVQESQWMLKEWTSSCFCGGWGYNLLHCTCTAAHPASFSGVTIAPAVRDGGFRAPGAPLWHCALCTSGGLEWVRNAGGLLHVTCRRPPSSFVTALSSCQQLMAKVSLLANLSSSMQLSHSCWGWKGCIVDSKILAHILSNVQSCTFMCSCNSLCFCTGLWWYFTAFNNT